MEKAETLCCDPEQRLAEKGSCLSPYALDEENPRS